MSKKMKIVLGIVAAVIVFGIIGAIGGGNDKAPAAAPTTTQAPAATEFTLLDYTGKALDEALPDMTANGVKTAFVDTVDGKAVMSPKNWVIESHDPAAGVAVAEGGTVTFNVSKPGAAEAKVEAEKVAAEKALEPTETSLGLTASPATAACERYAKDQFPFGVKMHWIVGNLAERIEDDQWFLKVEATVTTAFGAKEKGVNVECFVGGTNDVPVVNVFNAY